jgi:midasin (ATPase involved in ribosome maturation)
MALVQCRQNSLLRHLGFFRVFVTMNHGGDIGKKESSPAIRNRFTELWIHVTVSRSEYGPIISSCVTAYVAGIINEYSNLLLRAGDAIVDYVSWNLAES